MIDIRALRRSRGLTLTDLALLSGIPARTLAEIEHGMRQLDAEYRQELARILNIPAPQLGTAPATPAPIAPTWPARAAAALLVLGISMLAGLGPGLSQPPAAAREQRTAVPAAPTARRAAAVPARPIARPSPTPTPSATPAPTATPRFVLAADGPHGCPLAPAAGRVVMTQGYDEGTHAPAAVWGGIDLAVDADGDGEADPNDTQGQPIAATHGGVAQVYLNSWPAGNYVRVTDAQAGWSSAYAHLDSVAVSDGELISTGAILGTVGSTGMASGPHLHYELWHGQQNTDPSALVGCQ